MRSAKIKDKNALKARTFLNVRDKVHVCYWYWLSMHLSTENSAGYLQHVQILKTLHWRIFTYKKHPIHRNWISYVTDIKQTCLGQGLGVTITARKRPSKLMHVHHEGLTSYAAWSSKLNIDDIILCTTSLAISYVSHLFCAHLCAVPINFNCNDENRILGK